MDKSDHTMFMECSEDELSPAQWSSYNNKLWAFRTYNLRIGKLLKTRKARLIEKKKTAELYKISRKLKDENVIFPSLQSRKFTGCDYNISKQRLARNKKSVMSNDDVSQEPPYPCNEDLVQDSMIMIIENEDPGASNSQSRLVQDSIPVITIDDGESEAANLKTRNIKSVQKHNNDTQFGDTIKKISALSTQIHSNPQNYRGLSSKQSILKSPIEKSSFTKCGEKPPRCSSSSSYGISSLPVNHAERISLIPSKEKSSPIINGDETCERSVPLNTVDLTNENDDRMDNQLNSKQSPIEKSTFTNCKQQPTRCSSSSYSIAIAGYAKNIPSSPSKQSSITVNNNATCERAVPLNTVDLIVDNDDHMVNRLSSKQSISEPPKEKSSFTNCREQPSRCLSSGNSSHVDYAENIPLIPSKKQSPTTINGNGILCERSVPLNTVDLTNENDDCMEIIQGKSRCESTQNSNPLTVYYYTAYISQTPSSRQCLVKNNNNNGTIDGLESHNTVNPNTDNDDCLAEIDDVHMEDLTNQKQSSQHVPTKRSQKSFKTTEQIVTKQINDLSRKQQHLHSQHPSSMSMQSSFLLREHISTQHNQAKSLPEQTLPMPDKISQSSNQVYLVNPNVCNLGQNDQLTDMKAANNKNLHYTLSKSVPHRPHKSDGSKLGLLSESVTSEKEEANKQFLPGKSTLCDKLHKQSFNQDEGSMTSPLSIHIVSGVNRNEGSSFTVVDLSDKAEDTSDQNKNSTDDDDELFIVDNNNRSKTTNKSRNNGENEPSESTGNTEDCNHTHKKSCTNKKVSHRSKKLSANRKNLKFGNDKGSLIFVLSQMKEICRMTNSTIHKEEIANVDVRVTNVLATDGSEFIKKLFDLGLIRNQQYCKNQQYFWKHTDRPQADGAKSNGAMELIQLHSAHEGGRGFVWSCHQCKEDFVSVYHGSVFEGAPLQPAKIVSLIYYWCINAHVNYVMEKENLFCNDIFMYYKRFRAVCTAALHQHISTKVGGSKVEVEVCYIDLYVGHKITIIGAMEIHRNIIILKVISSGFVSHGNEKACLILHTLSSMVSNNSIIIIHSKRLLKQTENCHTFGSYDYKYTTEASNLSVFLETTVRKLFKQKSISLKLEEVQLFLDELLWRQQWDFSPVKTFEAFLKEVSLQNLLKLKTLYINALDRIAELPFLNWKYNLWPRCYRNICSTDFQTNPSFDEVVGAEVEDSNPNVFDRGVRSENSVSKKRVMTLNEYYYGCSSQQPYRRKIESLIMTCTYCFTAVANNIEMMEHLFHHALLNDVHHTSAIEKFNYCRHCLFAINGEMQDHDADCNAKPKSQISCLICLSCFQNEHSLLQHMRRLHVESELPYYCIACGFRTSEHRYIIDHFYKVHMGERFIQCPICLQVVIIVNGSFVDKRACRYFYQHIQRHLINRSTRRCDKCCLEFVNIKDFYTHKARDHVSQRGMVKRYPASGLIQLFHGSSSVPVSNSSNNSLLASHQRSQPYAQCSEKMNLTEFRSLKIKLSSPLAKCCECQSLLSARNHFPGYLKCELCTFSTFCQMAMSNHNSFHQGDSRATPTLREIILEKPMFCKCGFASSSGSKLAKHLISCGKKTLYPLHREVSGHPIIITID